MAMSRECSSWTYFGAVWYQHIIRGRWLSVRKAIYTRTNFVGVVGVFVKYFDYKIIPGTWYSINIALRSTSESPLTRTVRITTES